MAILFEHVLQIGNIFQLQVKGWNENILRDKPIEGPLEGLTRIYVQWNI